MKESKQTLVIIPDISGFTSFVNEVAITHSEHIVRELLELIMESNNIGLEVSEVEGDAVLFYKSENLPTPVDILNMVEHMFISFHEHLMLYNNKHICQCGACQTAHNLNLKVVIDQGYLKPISIKEHDKLIGPALIAAHRLLKNDIPSDEYLLLSERYVDYQECLDLHEEFDWIQWHDGYQEDKDFGSVNYKYAFLSPLKKRLKKPEEKKKEFSVKHPSSIQQTVDVNFKEAYQVITDSRKKINWVKGIKEVIKKSNEEIERIGSRHLCVIEGGEMEFEAVKGNELDNELHFMEVMQEMGPLKNLAFLYKCIHQGTNKCLIKLELHSQTNWLLNPKKAMALQMVKWQMKQSLKNLKDYLENSNK